MKIIGSEDYYDYIANIYGVDSKVVLDRREGLKFDVGFTLLDNSTTFHGRSISICICDTEYRGIMMPDGEMFWGDEIKQLGMVKEERVSWDGEIYPSYVKIESGTYRGKKIYSGFYHLSTPTEMNKKENCPILIAQYSADINRFGRLRGEKHYSKFPNRLQDISFPRVMDADTIYKTIYSWLLNRMQDGDYDVLNNKEKILAKGFDMKQSFRHRKGK